MTSEIYEFADFRLNVGERVLVHAKTGDRISLPDKAFDTLCVLVGNAGRLVTKDELLSRVWTDSFVEENNLNKSIHAIRRALGETNGGHKFIETVKKHGFRFVADVRHVGEVADRTSTDNSTVREFPHPVPRSEASATNGAGLALARPGTVVDEGPPQEPTVEQIHQPILFPVASKRAAHQPHTRYIAGTVLAALMIVGFLGYRYAGPTPSSTGSVLPKLAVLPLKPVNPDTRDRGMEFAIAHSLILKLSESKGFQVSHLSSVRKFVDLEQDPLDAARELSVDYVLASDYQISDGRIRVTSQLLNAGTGASEQTFKSESPASDLFAMQDTVANEIGNVVLARFGRPESNYAAKRGTQNERAFNLYYEAFYLVDKNTKDDSARATELLGQAVELDPNFAQAWALRAQAHCQFAHNGGGSPDQVFKIAEPMLERALSLDADSATALMVKGVIARDYHWRFDEAYRDLRRSLEIDPNNSHAHRLLSGLYFRERRFAEALEQQKIAVAVNPTSGSDRWFLGVYLIYAGQRDEGFAQLKRTIEMDPSWARPAYDALWQQYHRVGDHANAYENFIKLKELFGTKPEHMAALRNAYAKGGWPAVLPEELVQMKKQDPKGQFSGAKFYIATMAALTGDRDTAFDYLEEALRYRLIGMSFLKVEWRLDPIRDDPRFANILRRAGLSSGI